jgi:hypothetical protein
VKYKKREKRGLYLLFFLTIEVKQRFKLLPSGKQLGRTAGNSFDG